MMHALKNNTDEEAENTSALKEMNTTMKSFMVLLKTSIDETKKTRDDNRQFLKEMANLQTQQ